VTRPHGLTRYKHGPDEHGNPGGCRCAACSQANRDYQDRRARLIAYGQWGGLSDAAGTRRRLQALMYGGWSLGLLSARLGQSRQVLRVKLRDRGRVTAATVRAVRELCDELWNQPPPGETKFERRAATMARRYARERGWVPLLAWDEDAIDDPDAVPVAGWRRRGERRPAASPVAAAIREAREQAAMSRPCLAAIVGVTASAVQWWEQGMGVPCEENWVQLELTLGPLGVVREADPEPEAEEAEDAA